MIARMLAIVALAFALATGVQTWRLDRLERRVAEERAAVAEQVAAAERRAREAEQLMADGARKAAQTYATQIARVRVGAVGARSELDRLRNAIGVTGDATQDAATAARGDDAARTRLVVGQCAATLQALAATADTCESRLSGLQEWAKAVTQ